MTVIRKPSAADDRAPLVRVALVAIICAGAGVGLARWGVTQAPPHSSEETSESASTDGAQPEPVAEPEPTPEPVAPPPPPPPVARPTSALRLVRGRVAYLRCEGVERSGTPPCPRDEALEARVWTAIDALTTCATAPTTPGEADLVLELEGADAAPEVSTRDRFASDVVRLDGPSVAACLAPGLADARQHLGSAHLVVSFRFALRE